MTHSKILTKRRDFLKMLGLGGTAAATGLVAGSKVLGGVVAPPEATSSPIKTVPYNQIVDGSIERRIMEALRKDLREQSIISKKVHRDFSAPPGPATDRINVGRRSRPIVTITCGDKQSTLKFSDADLDLTLTSNPIFHTRGGLVTLEQGFEKLEGQLSGRFDWMKGDWIIDVFHEQGPFDLLVTLSDKEHHFKGCHWTGLSYDMAAADISIDFICGEGYEKTVR